MGKSLREGPRRLAALRLGHAAVFADTGWSGAEDENVSAKTWLHERASTLIRNGIPLGGEFVSGSAASNRDVLVRA